MLQNFICWCSLLFHYFWRSFGLWQIVGSSNLHLYKEMVCVHPSPPASSAHKTLPITVCEAAPNPSLKLVCAIMPKKKFTAVSLKDCLAHCPGLSHCHYSSVQLVVISCLTLGVQGLQLHHDELILVLVLRNRDWAL